MMVVEIKSNLFKKMYCMHFSKNAFSQLKRSLQHLYISELLSFSLLYRLLSCSLVCLHAEPSPRGTASFTLVILLSRAEPELWNSGLARYLVLARCWARLGAGLTCTVQNDRIYQKISQELRNMALNHSAKLLWKNKINKTGLQKIKI